MFIYEYICTYVYICVYNETDVETITTMSTRSDLISDIHRERGMFKYVYVFCVYVYICVYDY
jgi:hypothetical protein